jgi:hypothetical protein
VVKSLVKREDGGLGWGTEREGGKHKERVFPSLKDKERERKTERERGREGERE